MNAVAVGNTVGNAVHIPVRLRLCGAVAVAVAVKHTVSLYGAVRCGGLCRTVAVAVEHAVD